MKFLQVFAFNTVLQAHVNYMDENIWFSNYELEEKYLVTVFVDIELMDSIGCSASTFFLSHKGQA